MPSRLTNDIRVLRDPSAKLEYNRRLFAEVAPRYFVATRLLSLFRDKAWKRRLLSRLAMADPRVVLDIACGTGDLALLASRRWPDAMIAGCDISLDMMGLIGQQSWGSKVQMTCQDMAHLAVASQAADIVIGGYALRNAPDVSLTLAEIFRVLKPGGEAAFLDFSRSPNTVVFLLQYWVLRLWGGFWGLALHGNSAVYAYIAESLRLFPDWRHLREMMTTTGFCDIAFIRRMTGLVDIIVARKPLPVGNIFPVR